MLTEPELIKRLEQAGFKSREIKTVMIDVGKIILARTLEACVLNLTNEERVKLQSLSAEDLQKYLQEHKASASLLQEDFNRMHDDTWEEYFKAVS